MRKIFAAFVLATGLSLVAPAYTAPSNKNDRDIAIAEQVEKAFEYNAAAVLLGITLIGLFGCAGVWLYRKDPNGKGGVEYITREDFESMKADNKREHGDLEELVKELQTALPSLKDELRESQNEMEKRLIEDQNKIKDELKAEIHKLALAMANKGVKIED